MAYPCPAKASATCQPMRFLPLPVTRATRGVDVDKAGTSVGAPSGFRCELWLQAYKKCRLRTAQSIQAFEVIKREFDDLGWISIEIAIRDPGRARAHS